MTNEQEKGWRMMEKKTNECRDELDENTYEMLKLFVICHECFVLEPLRDLWTK